MKAVSSKASVFTENRKRIVTRAGAPYFFFGCNTKSGDKIVDNSLCGGAKIVCTVCINGYYSIFGPLTIKIGNSKGL